MVSSPPKSKSVLTAPIFIGVDGGGSKTVALLADAKGKVLGRGEAGTSNHHVAGWRAAFLAVSDAIAEAQSAARTKAAVAEAVCLGMAGADTVLDQQRLLRWLQRQRWGQANVVVNDGALLLAATGKEAGVAVVSGTGSIAWGQNSQGESRRSGGWGHVIGDEGSGYHLSIEALRHTVTAADGRAPWGPLPKAVLRFYGLKQAEGLLPYVYGPHITKADLAKLAPVVFTLAARGDAVAVGLVEQAASALASLILTVSGALGMKQPALAFGGSLLVRQKALRDCVLGKLPGSVGQVTLVKEPALGALHLARQAAR